MDGDFQLRPLLAHSLQDVDGVAVDTPAIVPAELVDVDYRVGIVAKVQVGKDVRSVVDVFAQELHMNHPSRSDPAPMLPVLPIVAPEKGLRLKVCAAPVKGNNRVQTQGPFDGSHGFVICALTRSTEHQRNNGGRPTEGETQ